MFHYRNCMPSFCSIFLPSSYTMHAPKQIISLNSPHIDRSLTHVYGKPKRGFGFHLSTTSYKLTLSISSNQPLRNPPGKPGASEQSTNHSQAAGVLLFAHYKKIAAPHHRRRPLKKCQQNSCAHQLPRKKKTSCSPQLPNVGALATNS